MSHVVLVVPPNREKDATEFLQTIRYEEQRVRLEFPSIELRLPPEFDVDPRTFTDRKNAPAAFGSWTFPPHVLLRQHFFEKPLDERMHILFHELRHAVLWNEESFAAYFAERARLQDLWQCQAPDLSDKTWKLFAAPLEVAVDTWVSPLFPSQALARLRQRRDNVRSAELEHRASLRRGGRTKELMIILDLAPTQYWFRHVSGAVPSELEFQETCARSVQDIERIIRAFCRPFFQTHRLQRPYRALMDETDRARYLDRAQTILQRIVR